LAGLVTSSSCGGVAEFAYDALGRRIRKIDSIANETTFYYYNNNWQVLTETDADGTTQRWFIYGNGTESPPRRIDEVLLIKADSNDYYYAQDHLYSPAALINSSGSVVERYEYDAYGNCYIMDASYNPRSSSNYGNPYLFTGRRVDILDSGSLKIQYNRNRYYDYYTGRWLTQDPLGITPNAQKPNMFDITTQYANGVNTYLYVIDNPVLLADAFGLDCKGDSFAIMGWLAIPKGGTPDEYISALKAIKGIGKLTKLVDLASPWKTGIISLAWGIGTGSVGERYFRSMVAFHVSQCGGDLYALACEWYCVTRIKGIWPFKKKIKVSEFDSCRWLKCKSKDACIFLPSRSKCGKRIRDCYFKIFKLKFHASFTKSDLDKIEKTVKKGAPVAKGEW